MAKSPAGRSKGQILGFLFGTATQDEAYKYTAATRQLQQKVGNVMHITKGLLTVVDQSRTYIRQNHHALIDLQHHEREIGKYVESLRNKMAGWERRLLARRHVWR